eukprot:TRINITY_DN446_c0_g6_i1.p1 TRINITY_DN446_c0_g6~~TRINITY_DN446_c0_g6_i1.p1  ORF type:complete len:114 (+),score=14.30 TRINITY_DN446_c0_g6_i1:250-591(+)
MQGRSWKDGNQEDGSRLAHMNDLQEGVEGGGGKGRMAKGLPTVSQKQHMVVEVVRAGALARRPQGRQQKRKAEKVERPLEPGREGHRTSNIVRVDEAETPICHRCLRLQHADE